MAVVFVKETCSVGGQDGGIVTLCRGEAWDASAPIVKEHPDLFADEPTAVLGRVERATRAPGEVRDAPKPTTRKK